MRVHPPSGSLRSPSGPSGKTNDKSFAQNTQLFPVFMPPSQKALRDINCQKKNPKTFRVASLCSATAFVSPLRGHTHERFTAFSDKSTKDESLKTLRRFVALSNKRPKGERPKSESTSLRSLTKDKSLSSYGSVGLFPTSASPCSAT